MDTQISKTVRDLLIINKNMESPILKIRFKNLSSIPDLSTYKWINELDLQGNPITEIKNEFLPPNLEKLKLSSTNVREINYSDVLASLTSLDLSRTSIKSFDGTNFDKLKILKISDSKLEQFIKFPKNVVKVDLENNELEDIPDLNDTLKELQIGNNRIRDIGNVNSSLENIDISFNYLCDLPKLPDSVKYLDFSENYISQISDLPNSLIVLVGSRNEISEILCSMPHGLEECYLEFNKLIETPSFYSNIKIINLNHNKISDINNIPTTVQELNVKNNIITTIPDCFKESKSIIIDYDNNFIDDDSSNCNDSNNCYYSYDSPTIQVTNADADSDDTSDSDEYLGYPRYWKDHNKDKTKKNKNRNTYSVNSGYNIQGGQNYRNNHQSVDSKYYDNNYYRNYYNNYNNYNNYSNSTYNTNNYRYKYGQQLKSRTDNPYYISIDFKKHYVV